MAIYVSKETYITQVDSPEAVRSNGDVVQAQFVIHVCEFGL
jgi:hypothetical protein